MSYSDISALWKYVQENYKGMTWREYLTMVGFDLSWLPKDSKLTFNGACSCTSKDCWVDAFYMDGPKKIFFSQMELASFNIGARENIGTWFTMFRAA